MVGWAITHSLSGYAVWTGPPTQDLACLLAEDPLELGDWTRSRATLQRDAQLKQRVCQLQTELVETFNFDTGTLDEENQP